MPLGMSLTGLSSVLLFSFTPVKEPLYILPATVFSYVLVGFCLCSLREARPSETWLLRPLGVATGCLSLLLVLGVLFAYSKGIKQDDITPAYVLTHTTVMLGLAVFSFLQIGELRRYSFKALYAGCIAVLIAFVAYTMCTQVPRDKAIADVIRPYVEARPRQDETFISPNFKSLQVYLYHHGRYWQSHQIKLPRDLARELPKFSAFVLGPDEMHNPAMATTIKFLQNHYLEKTAEVVHLIGRDMPYRVFVNKAWSPETSHKQGSE